MSLAALRLPSTPGARQRRKDVDAAAAQEEHPDKRAGAVKAEGASGYPFATYC